jgi:hypothetical protein
MITLDAVLIACAVLVFIGIIGRLFNLPSPSWGIVFAMWAGLILLLSSENIYHRVACRPVTYSIDGKVTKFEWDCEKH